MPGELAVPLGAGLGRAADDQRGAGLVDEDRVDLVDDREVVAALHEVGLAPGHVVAQVVEAELVVRAVGDVAQVLLAAERGRLAGDDRADGQAQEPVHPAHPLGVAGGEVVVGGDHVHAVAGERVQVRRQHAGQGLALTGLHLGDVAEVQRRTAHELHAVVPLAERAGGRLADDGERLGQQRVEGLPVGVPLLELVGLGPQLGVGQRDRRRRRATRPHRRSWRVVGGACPRRHGEVSGTPHPQRRRPALARSLRCRAGSALRSLPAVAHDPARPRPRPARFPHRAAPGDADDAARRRQPARRPGRVSPTTPRPAPPG